MRLLFLGNANSPLINNLARELRVYNPDFKIDIISDSRITFDGVSDSFDSVVELDNTKWYRKMKFVRILGHYVQCKRELKTISENQYDHVHVFFLYPSYGMLRNRLRRMCKSVIVSVFGSEFYLTSAIEKWLQGRFVKIADKVVASNKNTLRDFCSHYSVETKKQHIRLFGLKSLDFIQPLTSDDRSVFKKQLGIPIDRIVVTCGYNGSKNQNHIEIIKALFKVDTELKHKLFLLLPMTIGGSVEYRQQVVRELDRTDFEYMLLDKFMPSERIALVRQATDVMIQVQKSDQLSGAMLEHLFAQNILVTGSWLPYDFLDENGLFYYKLSSITELNSVLPTVLEEAVSTAGHRRSNRIVIWENCGWVNAQARWAALYKE